MRIKSSPSDKKIKFISRRCTSDVWQTVWSVVWTVQTCMTTLLWTLEMSTVDIEYWIQNVVLLWHLVCGAVVDTHIGSIDGDVLGWAAAGHNNCWCKKVTTCGGVWNDFMKMNDLDDNDVLMTKMTRLWFQKENWIYIWYKKRNLKKW